MLLHGITFGGHPMPRRSRCATSRSSSARACWRTSASTRRYIRERLEALRDKLPIVGDVRGEGFFWALELVSDADNARFNAEERERLLRGFLPGRLLQGA